MLALENKLAPEDLMLVTIALADHDPLSPIGLQIAMFMLQTLLDPSAGVCESCDFMAGAYGPRCPNTQESINDLVDRKLVRTFTTQEHRFHEHSITREGVYAATRIMDAWDDNNKDYAQRLVDWVLRQSLQVLLASVYKRWPRWKENAIFVNR